MTTTIEAARDACLPRIEQELDRFNRFARSRPAREFARLCEFPGMIQKLKELPPSNGLDTGYVEYVKAYFEHTMEHVEGKYGRLHSLEIAWYLHSALESLTIRLQDILPGGQRAQEGR